VISNLPTDILTPLSLLVRELERSDYGGAAMPPDRIADAKARTVEIAKKIEARKVSSQREGSGSEPLEAKGGGVNQ
jgi:hypothetical protein